jgi:hypothetical protein
MMPNCSELPQIGHVANAARPKDIRPEHMTIELAPERLTAARQSAGG